MAKISDGWKFIIIYIDIIKFVTSSKSIIFTYIYIILYIILHIMTNHQNNIKQFIS
jgi:hypothetical protein